MNERHLEEPDEQEQSMLINTIKFPQNFKAKAYKIDFPKPNYKPLRTRKRTSSNGRLKTTFDQNDLQYINKSMVDDRVYTETSNQQIISQRHLSQRQIDSNQLMEEQLSQILGLDQKENDVITRQQKQIKDQLTDISSLKMKKDKKNSINVINSHVNYMQNIERLSNIELNDQLLTPAVMIKESANQSVKSQNQYNNGILSLQLQQNQIQSNQVQNQIISNQKQIQQNQIQIQQNKILIHQNQNKDKHSSENSTLINQIQDNSKSISLADQLERKLLIKESISTNENKRKSNNPRQSSSLSTQTQPKNYSQMNKQKQLYRMMNQPAHLFNIGKGYNIPGVPNSNQSHHQRNIRNYNNDSILNQYNNQLIQNMSIINNESILDKLKDSQINLEKEIQSTRVNRGSLKHTESNERQFKESNKYEENFNINGQLSNKIPYQNYPLKNKGDIYQQIQYLIQQKQTLKKDRNSISKEDNIFDIQYSSQMSSVCPTTKNAKYYNQLNNENDQQITKNINNTYINRQSITIPQSNNIQYSKNKTPSPTQLEKSPLPTTQGFRKKSKTFFENNTIVTLPDTYVYSEQKTNKKDKTLQNTSIKSNIAHEDTELTVRIKKNSVRSTLVNDNSINNEKSFILPQINKIDNTRRDKSVSVSRKFSLINEQNNRNNYSLDRKALYLQEKEQMRKNTIEYQSKINEQNNIKHIKNENNNSNYKQSQSQNKHNYQQTPKQHNDKNNISLNLDQSMPHTNIHTNYSKPTKKITFSPNNNRNILSKLL